MTAPSRVSTLHFLQRPVTVFIMVRTLCGTTSSGFSIWWPDNDPGHWSSEISSNASMMDDVYKDDALRTLSSHCCNKTVSLIRHQLNIDSCKLSQHQTRNVHLWKAEWAKKNGHKQNKFHRSPGFVGSRTKEWAGPKGWRAPAADTTGDAVTAEGRSQLQCRETPAVSTLWSDHLQMRQCKWMAWYYIDGTFGWVCILKSSAASSASCLFARFTSSVPVMQCLSDSKVTEASGRRRKNIPLH